MPNPNNTEHSDIHATYITPILNNDTITAIDNDLLARDHPQARENFEYLLSILHNTSIPHARTFIEQVTADSAKGNGSTIPLAVLYSRYLITEVAKALHKKLQSSVNISRDATTTVKFHPLTAAPSEADVNIRLNGSGVIEGDDFVHNLFQILDYQQLGRYLFNLFIDTTHSKDPMVQLLTAMSDGELYYNLESYKLPSSAGMWFDRAITAQTMTKHTLLSTFIACILKDILKADMPDLIVALKIKPFYVDLIAALRTESDIFLDGWQEVPYMYHHVYFQGFDGTRMSTVGTIAVRSNGMFNHQHLQALLALRNNVEHALVISWQDLKDEATYNTFTA